MTFYLGFSSESYALLFLCIDDFNLLITVLAALRRLIAEKREALLSSQCSVLIKRMRRE